jgi:hypothetical protein
MQTLRRIAAVLTFPTIAYMGAACERMDTPTEARPTAVVVASATTLVVDDDKVQCPTAAFMTIQAAVDVANPGDIIMVCAGTYPELPTGGLLTVTKTLTLRGAQSGTDARSRLGLESVITATRGTSVSASNVIIDGFTVENSIAAAFTGYGIWINPGVSGTQILNNIIQNNIVGIGLANGSGSQAVIRHNLIQNNNQAGGASGTGIYTDEFVGGTTVTNVLIEENLFKGNLDAGIDVSNTDPTGGAFNLDISTNSFDLNGRAVLLFNTHTSSVHDNSITNSTLAGSAAIRLFDNNSDLSILNNNVITGVFHAIRFSFLNAVGGPSSNVVIHENNIEFFPAGDGLLVDVGSTTATVNAECNWWNSPSGPTNPSNPGGTGEKVMGDADFTPWLVAPAPTGGCAGGGPSGKVTGGGQINLTGGGVGSFGFNAKSDGGVGSGHLNYLNHVTRAHLDCTVTAVLITPPNKAKLSGPCSSTNAGGAMSFTADVEDNANPGKGADKFTISYGLVMNEGGTLTSGNIKIHQ